MANYSKYRTYRCKDDVTEEITGIDICKIYKYQAASVKYMEHIGTTPFTAVVVNISSRVTQLAGENCISSCIFTDTVENPDMGSWVQPMRYFSWMQQFRNTLLYWIIGKND
ncbi:hypothetical protein WN51_04841 [Melipona quadrifasciata]|uniref:Uncharacterized protein n=1 Tax=Melipona quadrifasciata TaxID=166423 RepID=A0A0N1IT71_9HYME|nr:hypothetical protein WN51_04841 [Melipona quadrifasciata]